MIPVKNKVLVRPFESDNVSSGGIILSDAHKEVSNKVKVISVGNGTKKTPMQFKPGDIGFRVKNCGEEVLIEGERHFIVEQSWIIARLN